MAVNTFTENNPGGSGVITVWHGLLSDIPQGFVLCDGNNNTPDLRGDFIKGTPSGATPGATGGQSSYTLSSNQMPSHSHGVSTNSTNNHTHDYRNSLQTDGADSEGSPEGSSTYDTWSTGSHSHSMTIDSTGSGASINNLPSYYEVAFIQRL